MVTYPPVPLPLGIGEGKGANFLRGAEASLWKAHLLLGGNNRDTSKYHVINAAIKNIIKKIVNMIAVFSGKELIVVITVMLARSNPKIQTISLE